MASPKHMNDNYLLKADKVAVIGLDCAVPDLVLNRWREELSNISTLVESGFGGVLKSIVPPITVPAWACMMSGLDPGELGLYGFRNRKDYSYDGLAIADSRGIKSPRVWDHLTMANRTSIVQGAPPSYPPSPIKGMMVGCFLTPDKTSQYTYPSWLANRIDKWAGGDYRIDVSEVRTPDKDRLLSEIREMTRARFTLAGRLLEEPWDFFMMVEMGPDRLHHGFWHFFAQDHHRYKPGNPWENVIHDYYVELDEHIGRLINKMPDKTLIMIVSDHGARTLHGGVAINEWLIREGLLALKDPGYKGPLNSNAVDWPKTRVWGEGGYMGRLFFNMAGREPLGVLQPSELDGFKQDLISKLENMLGPDGRLLHNRVIAPEETYNRVEGIPPDLMVLFGDLDYRSIGSVGQGSVFTQENDTGPDSANHDMNGLLAVGIKGRKLPEPASGRVLSNAVDIRRVTPTILKSLGVKPIRPLSVEPIDPWKEKLD
jgi:predicted AlkP superfamily phosphohydrolase/phosphomutase